MSEQFKYLFTPIKVGNMMVRNRIVSTAHVTLYAKNNKPSEQHAYYYAEKAKGGIGLIIMEATFVHPTSQPYNDIVLAWEQGTIPGFQKIAEMVHAHDTKILAQLCHVGQHSMGLHNMREAWAPSAVPSARRSRTPKAMEKEDIREVVEGFGKAAKVVKEGNFDGVEIHGASGYLVQQFLSPQINKRTDEYGGSLENRMRFLMEVIDEIRDSVGSDFVVGIRISGDELVPGGLTLDDMKVVAKRLEDTGKIDYINVNIGTAHNMFMMAAPMYVPLGYATYLAAGIREVVDKIPVITIGRINDPLLAEKILAEGQADLVGMTRATIADPELPNKAKEGRLEDIRTCIACNEGCIGRRSQEKWVSCTQNPTAGREKELGIDTIKPAVRKKRVMVIGGGPAGMEAARMSATRGHQVDLYEKKMELGGQINLLTKAPSREEYGGIVRFLSGQLKKLGVKVHLNIDVTPGLVEQTDPDAIVIATGSRPIRSGFNAFQPHLDGIPGAERDFVLSTWDALEGKNNIGDKVVIIDDDNDHQVAGVAEYLAEQGKSVEIICRLPWVASETGLTNTTVFIYRRLLTKGVIFTPNSWVKEIGDRSVTIFNLPTNEERVIQPIDHVILATGNEANAEIYFALKSKVKEIYRVGDCLAPRKTIDAVYEGHVVGRKI
jgi:mycofactocin system FadH/OYE family oxidoreductase 2